MSVKQYLVLPFYTGCLSGGLDEKKLTGALNERAAQGWTLQWSIHESKRVFLFFQRESHFLIFVKDRDGGKAS